MISKALTPAVAACSALLACPALAQPESALTPAIRDPIYVRSALQYPIPATCRVDVDNATRAYRIVIRDNFDVKNIRRSIKIRSANGSGTNEDSGTGAGTDAPEPSFPSNIKKTRLDIDLGTHLGSATSIAIIKIKIKDEDIHFIEDASRNPLITTDGAYGQDILCGVRKVTEEQHPSDNKQYPMTILYVQRATNGVKGVAGINIGLAIEDDDEDYITPIILDPKVKNDG